MALRQFQVWRTSSGCGRASPLHLKLPRRVAAFPHLQSLGQGTGTGEEETEQQIQVPLHQEGAGSGEQTWEPFPSLFAETCPLRMVSQAEPRHVLRGTEVTRSREAKSSWGEGQNQG